MLSLYDVPAPAKLNLFLHITGRRPDGYHELQSVFMLIDWCDTLDFELRTDGVLSREDLTEKLPPVDLSLQAAQALQKATGCTQGAHIRVTKRIPSQAGMGGGSSDAATTLLALNRLWGLHLKRSELQRIGLSLGADVPFFLCGTNAFVEGIGDILTPLEKEQALKPNHFIVIKPQAGLETKSIFSSPSLKRNSERATILDFAAKHFDFGQNDLQPVAQALCDDVKKAVNLLETIGLHARMTGSGSAVFASNLHIKDVPPVPQGWQVRQCKNLMIHPLAGWASN